MSSDDALNFCHERVHAGFQPHLDSILVDIALKLRKGHLLFDLAPDGVPISGVVDGGQELVANLVDLAFGPQVSMTLMVHLVSQFVSPSHYLVGPPLPGSHLGQNG